MGQLSPAAAGNWQLQPTLTVTAIRTMCFTMPTRAKQRSGILIIMFTLALRGAQLSPLGGAYSPIYVIHGTMVASERVVHYRAKSLFCQSPFQMTVVSLCPEGELGISR